MKCRIIRIRIFFTLVDGYFANWSSTCPIRIIVTEQPAGFEAGAASPPRAGGSQLRGSRRISCRGSRFSSRVGGRICIARKSTDSVATVSTILSGNDSYSYSPQQIHLSNEKVLNTFFKCWNQSQARKNVSEKICWLVCCRLDVSLTKMNQLIPHLYFSIYSFQIQPVQV